MAKIQSKKWRDSVKEYMNENGLTVWSLGTRINYTNGQRIKKALAGEVGLTQDVKLRIDRLIKS